MIKEFYLTAPGIELIQKINSDRKDYPDFFNSPLGLKYANSKQKGLMWKTETETIEISEPNQKIYGYPTDDLKKVIVVYSQTHPKYPASKNAVMYNADGTIFKVLEIPPLRSSLFKKRLAFFGNDNGFDYHFTSNIFGFHEDCSTIIIEFDERLYEERYIDPETGIIGGVYSTGGDRYF